MSGIRGFFAGPPSLGIGVLLLSMVLFNGGSVAPPTPAPGAAPCPAGGRLAIAALDGEARALISPRAGRGPYFLLFDPATGRVEAVVNEFADRERGAGTRAAYLLADLEVDCLVAGEAGARMRGVLAAEGIGFVVAEGRALEVAGAMRGRRR